VVACKDDYRRRYTVERTFAWLGAFRWLLIRWERQCAIYHSFFTVAPLLVCVRHLSKVRTAEPFLWSTELRVTAPVRKQSHSGPGGEYRVAIRSLGLRNCF
jgi:hypothetical protein